MSAELTPIQERAVIILFHIGLMNTHEIGQCLQVHESVIAHFMARLPSAASMREVRFGEETGTIELFPDATGQGREERHAKRSEGAQAPSSEGES